MLKALELNGFKSFADETRFEFPPGITVVVGPNGSGKSNIVDAMKWVLGEQSARSLRGKEMADVIFKGSGSGNRKPANTAEATIIFDNIDNILGVGTSEVRVTRRVYRSGEGEYLINGSACRLRDIRDMFRGTGVGTDAYSLIEQGKVDSLLQASAKDRRAIFEEAAGISRFKAKKIETQRRLERVDQNLLRLSDIVEEVDSRLQRLKSQATKARRYKEHADRLQALRTQVGRVDWQRMTARLEVVMSHLVATAAELETARNALQQSQSEAAQFEQQVAQIDTALQEYQTEASRARERIAARQAIVDNGRVRLAELEEELCRYRRQLLAMTSRAGSLQSQWQTIRTQLEDAERDHAEKCDVLRQEQLALDDVNNQAQSVREQAELRRAEYVDAMQKVARFSEEIAKHQSRMDAATQRRERAEAKLEEMCESVSQADDEANWMAEQLEQLQHQAELRDVELAQSRTEQASLAQSIGSLEQERIEVRERHAVLSERVTVLEEIESRMDGVGSGVQELLAQAREGNDPLVAGIRGMVADLIRLKDPGDAAMIAAAIGERAQHLVLAGSELIDAIARGVFHVPGRVGFVRLHASPPPAFLRNVHLEDESGIIARADQRVESDKQYAYTVQWLLGDSWLVETLEDAVRLHRSLPIPPRLVTRTGEVIDRDGRMIVGPPTIELQIIPRRAELGTLRHEIERLSQRLAAIRVEAEVWKGKKEAADTRAEAATAQADEASRELADARFQSASASQRLAQLRQDQAALLDEQAKAERESTTLTELLSGAQSQLAKAQVDVRALDAIVISTNQQAEALQASQAELSQRVTAARVVTAKSEQNFEILQTRCAQLQRDQDEREAAIAESRRLAEISEQRRSEAERTVLRASAEMADAYLAEQAANERARDQSIQRRDAANERARLIQQIDALRDRLHELEQQQHADQLEVERLQHERNGLADRLKEDYGIETESLAAPLTEEERAKRNSVDEEISELRRKITNIGSVNMDALDELSDLETRYETLSGQYKDLVDAKESLERIINKINTDSRRLFSETLEAIRKNFQVLFRKVFGGGSADIILESDVDILEAGIDIVATPPGKQSLGLSLLSGGERALTAVTLLMAIFQYRPSPFCVLDEVDGPLDEANIGRFIDVLKGFLEWTKFVVVTHSKKTMTAAHTLYGVTMQESGISKRVSVRFEDVSDDGHISSTAIERNPSRQDASSKNSPDGDDDERGAA